MTKRTELTATMTEAEFENGYWYATELQEFGAAVGIPSAKKLRKDELENALKHLFRTGESKILVRRSLSKSGARDVDKGLRLDLPVVHRGLGSSAVVPFACEHMVPNQCLNGRPANGAAGE